VSRITNGISLVNVTQGTKDWFQIERDANSTTAANGGFRIKGGFSSVKDGHIGGNFFLHNVKAGATQGGAGAGANEVWKTSGHASLPDNLMFMGV
jgi:hypothetical protein